MLIFLAMRSHGMSRLIDRQIVCAVKSCDCSSTAYSLAVISKTIYLSYRV